MRIPLIAGNWKMYKTVIEAVKYIKEFRDLVKDVDDVEIVIAPTFTAIYGAADAARNSNLAIAAQDMYWEREGAFTGEVGGSMIREAGAELVIIGHSERRTLFSETDATVNRKLHAAYAAGLSPIACIGETLDQRERGETFDVLDRQIKQGLDGLTGDQIAQLVIAYEPVWAIGTGRRGAYAHPAADSAVVWRGRGRALPRDLRRQRQTGQHPRPDFPGQRRWRPGRRRQPGRPVVFRHRLRQPPRVGIIGCYPLEGI